MNVDLNLDAADLENAENQLAVGYVSPHDVTIDREGIE